MSLRLSTNFGVLGELELVDAMWLKSVPAPDPLHRIDADADHLRHGRTRPMRDLARQRLHRQGDDALGDRGIELGDALGPCLVGQKPLEPLERETLLPAQCASLGLAGLAHDRVRADALGAQHHDLRPPRHSRRLERRLLA